MLMKSIALLILLCIGVGASLLKDSIFTKNLNSLNEDLNYQKISLKNPNWKILNVTSNNSWNVKAMEAFRGKEKDKIILLKPLIEIVSSGGFFHKAEAGLGEINTSKKILSLKQEAIITTLNSEENYELKSSQIDIDGVKDKISSDFPTRFSTTDLFLEAKRFILEKETKETTKITFVDSRILKLDKDGKEELFGKSRIMKFFPNSNLLILINSAELTQKDVTIQADEILYDILKRKILSSKGSKLINKS